MFSFFRRRKEADATARRIIDQGRFLGARTPREAVEILWGRPLIRRANPHRAFELRGALLFRHHHWDARMHRANDLPARLCVEPAGELG
jgi:hypothetical protein